ncbi:MAG: hypothetical protein U0168_27700 [Nannocystaceae bacterium]
MLASLMFYGLIHTAFTPPGEIAISTSSSPAAAPQVPAPPAFDRTGYFIMGSSPMVSMWGTGFSPGIRYDAETGFAFTRKHVRIAFGANPKLVQYFGRKRPGGGLDGVVTASWRSVYVRAGVGVMAGLPTRPDLRRVLPAVGGVAGIGVQTMRDHVGGRFGVDYDLLVDTAGIPIHTVMLTLQLWFG